MQKIWRLTTAAIKNFSLFQFEPVLVQKSLKTTVTTMDNNNINASSITANASASASSAIATKTRLSEMIKFLEVVGNLKHIKRTGWVLRDVNDCETVAGHMYRMGIMTFLLGDDKASGLDRIKCMELALIHDLAESIVGDITPYCGISKEEKKQKELKAMEDISKLIGSNGEKLLKLFVEYEENSTPESKFVKDLDRLDMVLQAFEYEKRDKCPQKHQEFFDSTDGKFNHPLVVDLVDEIKSQRKAIVDGSTNDVDDGIVTSIKSTSSLS